MIESLRLLVEMHLWIFHRERRGFHFSLWHVLARGLERNNPYIGSLEARVKASNKERTSVWVGSSSKSLHVGSVVVKQN